MKKLILAMLVIATMFSSCKKAEPILPTQPVERTLVKTIVSDNLHMYDSFKDSYTITETRHDTVWYYDNGEIKKSSINGAWYDFDYTSTNQLEEWFVTTGEHFVTWNVKNETPTSLELHYNTSGSGTYYTYIKL